jgi:Heterokaryon incompatibility protein (HET)
MANNHVPLIQPNHKTDSVPQSYQHHPDEDVWLRIVDDSVSSRFLPIIEQRNSTSKIEIEAELCDRCRNLNLLDDDFKFYVNIARLEKLAGACQLCRMLRNALKQAGVMQAIRPIIIYRDGTNLKADYHDQPVLRLCAEQVSIASDIQVGLHTLPDSTSELRFKILLEWLRDCDENHTKFGCHRVLGRNTTDFLPTRLLDIGDGSNPDSLRLYCTKAGDNLQYIALSHCWGKPSRAEWDKMCTHKENFQHRCNSFASKSLPKTFQDAITVTRNLGKRYLWIDSICIIQGDSEDWEQEAVLMEKVFSAAYCTISATSAKSFNDGFLLSRPDRTCIQLPHKLESIGSLWLCETIDNFRADVEEAQVNQRGWVFQERVLSRRTIYFASNQAYFECGGGVFCETMTRLRK